MEGGRNEAVSLKKIYFVNTMFFLQIVCVFVVNLCIKCTQKPNSVYCSTNLKVNNVAYTACPNLDFFLSRKHSCLCSIFAQFSLKNIYKMADFPKQP